MFGSLFIKECKMWLKSIVFYAYIIILFLFYVTNMDVEDGLQKPVEGMAYYGETYSDDKEIIMNGALEDLIFDYDRGSVETYPMGFYKQVILSDSELKEIEECISELTGMDTKEWKDELDKYNSGIHTEQDDNGEYVTVTDNKWNIQIADNMSYDEFKKIMKKVCGIIGRGSDYEADKLTSHGMVKMTYEQALEKYNEIIDKDKVTGAYARLFSDYTVIILGLLPAFFAITRVIKEKRSKAKDVVYSKKVKGLTLVLARYSAMVAMAFIPVVCVALFALTQSAYIAISAGVSPDLSVYFKYCLCWLLPTIIFVLALSYLMAEFTESVISVLIIGGLWFISLFSALTGTRLIHVGWNIMPRFNTLGEYSVYTDIFPQLVKNRCLYLILGIAIIILTAAVYNLKRNGGLKKWKKS